MRRVSSCLVLASAIIAASSSVVFAGPVGARGGGGFVAGSRAGSPGFFGPGAARLGQSRFPLTAGDTLALGRFSSAGRTIAFSTVGLGSAYGRFGDGFRRDGFGYGYGGYGYGFGAGYGGCDGCGGGPVIVREPAAGPPTLPTALGIREAPVSPPAIYVIEPGRRNTARSGRRTAERRPTEATRLVEQRDAAPPTVSGPKIIRLDGSRS
jgi:hypothetical protein